MIQISVGVFVVAVATFVYFVAAHKVAPEGSADVYGDQVVTNAGGFVWLPTARRRLDLSPRPITTTAGPLAGPDGQQVGVVLDADISIGEDHDAIRAAAQHFAGAEEGIDPVAGELIEDAVAKVVADSTSDQLADRVDLAGRIRDRALPSLARLGLVVDWLSISSLTTGSGELIAR